MKGRNLTVLLCAPFVLLSCDAINTLQDTLAKQQQKHIALRQDLEQALGVTAHPSWEWTNGRLTELSVSFSGKEIDFMSIADLRDATLPILAEHFKDLPEVVYLSAAFEPEEYIARDAKEVPHNPGLVINARVHFVQDDGHMSREALPVEAFVLWFPFIGGDLYGSPTTGDFIRPRVAADYSFSFDLNNALAAAKRSVKVAAWSYGQSEIKPADLKMLRVATFALNRKTVKRVAYTGWRNGETGESFVLAYFDRAGTISGSGSFKGHQTEYRLDVPSDGFYWLQYEESSTGTAVSVRTAKPENLVLTLAPLDY